VICGDWGLKEIAEGVSILDGVALELQDFCVPLHDELYWSDGLPD
jgi:hypothetical protein